MAEIDKLFEHDTLRQSFPGALKTADHGSRRLPTLGVLVSRDNFLLMTPLR
jgi:hypothetical protein